MSIAKRFFAMAAPIVLTLGMGATEAFSQVQNSSQPQQSTQVARVIKANDNKTADKKQDVVNEPIPLIDGRTKEGNNPGEGEKAAIRASQTDGYMSLYVQGGDMAHLKLLADLLRKAKATPSYENMKINIVVGDLPANGKFTFHLYVKGYEGPGNNEDELNIFVDKDILEDSFITEGILACYDKYYRNPRQLPQLNR